MGNGPSLSDVGDAFASVGKTVAKSATSFAGSAVDGLLNPLISTESFGLIPNASLGGSASSWLNSQYKKGGRPIKPSATKLKNGSYRVSHPLVGTNVIIPVGHPHHATVARMMGGSKKKAPKKRK